MSELSSEGIGTHFRVIIVTEFLFGTEGGARTRMMSPSPDFESGASTNSATSAWSMIVIARSARQQSGAYFGFASQ